MAPVEERLSEGVGIEIGLRGRKVEMESVRPDVSDHGLVRLAVVEGVTMARGGGRIAFDAEDASMKTC